MRVGARFRVRVCFEVGVGFRINFRVRVGVGVRVRITVVFDVSHELWLELR